MDILTVSISENMWHDFGLAPKDGTIIYVKDSEGNVDIAMFDGCGWTAEIGCCNRLCPQRRRDRRISPKDAGRHSYRAPAAHRVGPARRRRQHRGPRHGAGHQGRADHFAGHARPDRPAVPGRPRRHAQEGAQATVRREGVGRARGFVHVLDQAAQGRGHRAR